MTRLWMLLPIAALFTGQAAANDSIATLGAGGLELVNSDSIVMAEEDLYISAERVKVDYVFQNRADEPKRHLVAFPMPLIEPGAYNEGDIALADREADNFMQFSVTVEGKAIEPRLDLRALSGPLDITDQLQAAGLPLNPLQRATDDAVRVLTPEAAAPLLELGAIGDYEGKFFFHAGHSRPPTTGYRIFRPEWVFISHTTTSRVPGRGSITPTC